MTEVKEMSIRLMSVVVILSTVSTIAHAQMAGDVEIGGSIAFRGESESGTLGSTNQFIVRPRLGYYITESTEIEIDASVNFNFTTQMSLTENETTLQILQHIAAMEGSESKIFLLCGGGVWSNSESEQGRRATTDANAIIVFGAGTKSFVGKRAIIRADVQLRNLLPAGSVYTKKRNIFQANIGVGLIL
jgi:hypothetical protein